MDKVRAAPFLAVELLGHARRFWYVDDYADGALRAMWVDEGAEPGRAVHGVDVGDRLLFVEDLPSFVEERSLAPARSVLSADQVDAVLHDCFDVA